MHGPDGRIVPRRCRRANDRRPFTWQPSQARWVSHGLTWRWEPNSTSSPITVPEPALGGRSNIPWAAPCRTQRTGMQQHKPPHLRHDRDEELECIDVVWLHGCRSRSQWLGGHDHKSREQPPTPFALRPKQCPRPQLLAPCRSPPGALGPRVRSCR